MKHPIQPIVSDKHGVARFKENKIVSYLLDKGGLDLNSLVREDFEQNDWEQFYQLIGYSLGGFGDLSRVSDETYETASLMCETGKSEIESRNIYLEGKIKTLESSFAEVVKILGGYTKDDFN